MPPARRRVRAMPGRSVGLAWARGVGRDVLGGGERMSGIAKAFRGPAPKRPFASGLRGAGIPPRISLAVVTRPGYPGRCFDAFCHSPDCGGKWGWRDLTCPKD